MLAFCYSSLIRLVLPVILLRLFWRSWREGQWPDGWLQRLGYVEPISEPVIWLHAVSVGETIAAAPLVRGLQQRFPDIRILVTATTLTGAERARDLFGDSVHYAYMPYDTPGAVARFFARIQPLALVIMETELWPNLISRAHRQQLPVMIMNARMSARSAAGYARFATLMRPMLSKLSWLAVQAEEDAGRFEALGVAPSALTVTGNIKFDIAIAEPIRDKSATLRDELGGDRPIWIAASTHEGEDRMILSAHRELLKTLPTALLVLVPRHPERFDAMHKLVLDMGLSCARRSAGQPTNGAQVYLGDTMGELLMFYGAGDLAFIGGSLVGRGGHNPLEAAAWGLPLLTGPHIFNFEMVYRLLQAGNGVRVTANEIELTDQLVELMTDPEQRKRLGDNAAAVLTQHRGALQQMVDGIAERLKR